MNMSEETRAAGGGESAGQVDCVWIWMWNGGSLSRSWATTEFQKKSTLAKHINAILAPTEGTMWVGGMDTKEEKRHLEYPADGRNGFPESGQPDHRQRGGRGRGFGQENLGVPSLEIWDRVRNGGNAGIPAPFPKPPVRQPKQRVAIAGCGGHASEMHCAG